jgi:two-component system, OmpR family, response regulator QseB
MHLLIIEDDVDLGQALLSSLKLEGFTSVWVRKAQDALPLFQPDTLDCVLLDLNLPDGHGLDLLERWRADNANVPIIVITASVSLADRLRGLDGGADDFVVKPFAMEELVSRIRAVCRRSSKQSSETWAVGALRLKPRSHEAWLNEQPLELSLREFRLLQELARDPGQVISKGLLGRRLEPLGEPVDAATIEVHLSNLRRKIGAERIRTVRGVGYQYVP